MLKTYMHKESILQADMATIYVAHKLDHVTSQIKSVLFD